MDLDGIEGPICDGADPHGESVCAISWQSSDELILQWEEKGFELASLVELVLEALDGCVLESDDGAVGSGRDEVDELLAWSSALGVLRVVGAPEVDDRAAAIEIGQAELRLSGIARNPASCSPPRRALRSGGAPLHAP